MQLDDNLPQKNLPLNTNNVLELVTSYMEESGNYPQKVIFDNLFLIHSDKIKEYLKISKELNEIEKNIKRLEFQKKYKKSTELDEMNNAIKNEKLTFSKKSKVKQRLNKILQNIFLKFLSQKENEIKILEKKIKHVQELNIKELETISKEIKIKGQQNLKQKKFILKNTGILSNDYLLLLEKDIKILREKFEQIKELNIMKIKTINEEIRKKRKQIADGKRYILKKFGYVLI